MDWRTLTTVGATVAQAFAAIIALGIAVWSTLRTDKAIKRREHLQARSIATAIFPDILTLAVCADRSRSLITALVPKAINHVGQSFAASLLNARIGIPPMLMRNVDGLYLLGEPAGPTCLQLTSIVLQYDDLVQTAAAQIASMDKTEWGGHVQALDGHLKAIKILVTQAQQQIQPIHDPQ